MRADDLHYWGLLELAERLERREVSPVEVTRAQLERIDALDPKLHAFVTVLPEAALDEARRAEADLAAGRYRGPLHGVPVAVKDLCATKGVRTTAGQPIRDDHVPDHDATVVERLRSAGAVLLGKLALTEGAYAAHREDRPAPLNPWDESRWPGVSSSGSGVATAAGLCFASLGTDTGGSIRFPSACCGLAGLKPTYGRVSRYGVLPLAESLDHVGPMARRTGDAAAVLGAIAGADPRDPTSRREPVPDYLAELHGGIRGVRLGVDESYCTEQVAPEVAEAVLRAADVLVELGAERRAVKVPPIDTVLRSWNAMAGAEALVAHADTFPARAAEYGAVFRAFLEAGQAVTGADYAQAHLARLALSGRLAGVFEGIDLLLCPTLLAPAPPASAFDQPVDDPGTVAQVLRFTAPFDYTGSPTLCLPCGFTDDGIPLGCQLVARPLEEALLCRAGAAFESATEWHTRHPEV